MYRWIDRAGAVVNVADNIALAGWQHRIMCRADVRCLDRNGRDVSALAIVASIDW